MQILNAALYRYGLPLACSLPLKSTRLERRQGLIVALELQDGGQRCHVYGEAAPLPDFSQETLDQAQAQLVQILSAVPKHKPLNHQNWLGTDLFPSVGFALESALWQGRQFFHGSVLNADDITLPVAPLLTGDPEAIVKRLSNWSGERPAEFKLKVARGSVAADIDLLDRILAILPDSVRLRLDANRRWSLSEACEFAGCIPQERITYIEEPVSRWQDCGAFYEATHMPYAWDETLQNPAFEFQPQPGLAALVIKPTLVGGLSRCELMVGQAEKHGLRVVVSSSFESILGVDILKQLGHHWAPSEAAGLDTLSAFQQHLYTGSVPMGTPLPEPVLQQMELIWH